jgi:hypothetical protein
MLESGYVQLLSIAVFQVALTCTHVISLTFLRSEL